MGSPAREAPAATKALISSLPRLVDEAAARISPHVLETPLYPSTYLTKMLHDGGCRSGDGGGSENRVWLKLESEQYTGSFKARGALNRILSATPTERRAGFVTSSTGNHGLGFCRALSIASAEAAQSVSPDSSPAGEGSINGVIYLPRNADPSKVEALRQVGGGGDGGGVRLVFHETYDCAETEVFAKSEAARLGMTWVSPYNDPAVIAGQGTVGREIVRQLQRLQRPTIPPASEDEDGDCRKRGLVVLVTVGGGGLASGVASYVRAHRPGSKVVGCLPEVSPEMYLSVQKGEAVSIDDEEGRVETLSDGSAGGVEPGAVTIDLCREFLEEDYELVSEKLIADGVRFMARKHHKMVEGAAGVALGAFLRDPSRFIIDDGVPTDVVIVICGANIGTEKLKELL